MVAGGGTMASAPPPAIGGNGGCTGLSAKISNLPGTTTAATTNMAASPQGTNEGGPTRTRTSENRRSNKPIMEKRRRARINNCLNELKTLILDAMKKDPARHSKLEKADILEMTVKHLEALQRQQVAMAAATDPNVANKFRAGFTECAGEVGRFPGLEGPVKRRLLQHLANCLNSTSPPNGSPAPAPAATPVESAQSSTTPPTNPATTANSPLQVHILRTPAQTDVQPNGNPSNIILTNTNGQGVQLVPTRLPNGDIALILPSSNAFRATRATAPVTPSSSPSPSVSSTSSGSSPLPMLIPIPQRTSANSPPIAIDRLSMNPSTPPRQITIVTTPNSQRILLPQHQQQTSVESKNAPLVTYECGDEQRPLLPDNQYQKPDKVIPVMREVDPAFVEASRKDVVYEERMSPSEDRLYDRDRIIMTRDGRIIEREHVAAAYESRDKDAFRQDRETLIHIPERDSYYGNISPRSPIGYVDDHDHDHHHHHHHHHHHKYGEYYPDQYDERPYSPDMAKPLALVTRKKCEEYGNEERPWRPW